MPMAQLRSCLQEAGFENIRTLLNSGNIVFETKEKNFSNLEDSIEKLLSQAFGFPIPVIIREQKSITALIEKDPFAGIELNKDIRLYVSFLKSGSGNKIPLPYISEDKAFRIISIMGQDVVSYLDLSKTKTVKGMDDLERLFGKNITTRNWNTILKIGAL